MPLGSQINVNQATGTPQTVASQTINGDEYQGVLICNSTGDVVDTLPVRQAVESATGVIDAAGETVVCPLNGAATVVMSIDGTWSGTWQIEVSPDNGGKWSGAVYGIMQFDGQAWFQTNNFSFTSSAAGVYRLNVGGFTHIRARALSWTSGSMSVRFQTSMAASTVLLSHSLPTGTNTIGNIGNTVGSPVGVRLSDGAGSLTTTGGRLAVDNTGQTQPVSDAGGSLTVDSPQLPSALVSDRLAVDGSGVTQPVSIAGTLPVGDAGASLTVDAPQGTPVFTRLTDGTNNAAITNSEPTSSTYGIVTRAIQQSTPTFWAVYDRVAPATNKYMAVLWNTTSTRLVKVRRVWRMDWQVGAVVGVLLEQEMRLITARTGVGTTVTPVAVDTADTLTAGIEASHNATGVTDGGLLSRVFAVSEEVILAATGQVLGLSSDERYQIVYEESRGSAKPITLRQNRGLAIKNITASTIGTVSYIIEFTDEAV